jgi:hypothetical protein
MARWFSGLKGLRGGGVFAVLAVVAFGAVVFLLFRGHSAGPQEAAASAAPAVSSPVDPAGDSSSGPALGTGSDPASTSGQEQNPLAGAAQPSTGAADLQSPEVEAAIAEAVKLIRSQPADVIEARNRLNKLLQAQITPEQRPDGQGRDGETVQIGCSARRRSRRHALRYLYRGNGDLLDILGRG